MTHEATSQDGRVEATTAAVETDVSKAMAMVFKDGELVGLVHCWHTLWATTDWIMANAARDPERAVVVSYCFDGIGNPMARAHSFAMLPDGWQALGLDDEDRFHDWLPCLGLLTEDDDADQAAAH
jgi:hypothetical protein